ncbi:uncharacterized protein [Ptychodera flava]
MTEVIQQAERLQKIKVGSITDEVSRTDASSKHFNVRGGDGDNIGKGNDLPQKDKVDPKSKQKQGPSTFAGMKKGFLFGSGSGTKPKPKSQAKSTSAAKAEDDIPFIKAKDVSVGGTSKAQPIPEVQEALRSSNPLLQSKGWITDELLSTIEKRPDLMRKLADPKFSEALAKFQANPQLASREYESNTEVQKFLTDFSGILGEHFTKLAYEDLVKPSQQPSGDQVRPGDIRTREGAGADIKEQRDHPEPSADDMKQMQDILSKPDIQAALQDPKIQNLIELLRTRPDDAQRIIRTADSEMKQKIQKLVDAGLLAFAS